MKDLMIDIETMGIKPGCPVISIGAVYFDRYTGETGDQFYMSMGANALFYGELDNDTVEWWGAPERSQAYQQMMAGECSPPVVANAFASFIKEDTKPWGNGSVFDITILEAWFAMFNVKTPWKFWNIRDVRTVVDIAGINPRDYPRLGTYHNALDDCLTQINYTCKALACLR